MKTKNYILFIIPSLIWGSTWYAITFQLGVVHPILSVAYRFALAGIVLLLYCCLSRRNMKYSPMQHLFMFLQGASLFGFNYWLVYLAENYITSGLVAVIFSLIIFFNIFFNSIFLNGKINNQVLIGAILGIVGTVLIFKKELLLFNATPDHYKALLYCLLSVVLASLGNIISSRNQKDHIPVLQANAYGMSYGALAMIVFAMFANIEFSFDFTVSYMTSLIYLSLFGSIIAFTAYLQLLGNIGPDRSAYTILVVPMIAMIISTIFEGYVWQRSAIFGILFLLSGNFMAMNKRVKFLKGKTV